MFLETKNPTEVGLKVDTYFILRKSLLITCSYSLLKTKSKYSFLVIAFPVKGCI